MIGDTIYLDEDTWDLALDINGNIAQASPPYARAQDVVSAIKLFKGELFYDITKGIEYKTFLGGYPSLSFVASKIENAAKTVPGVISALCTLIAIQQDRKVIGELLFTDSTGSYSIAL